MSKRWGGAVALAGAVMVLLAACGQSAAKTSASAAGSGGSGGGSDPAVLTFAVVPSENATTAETDYGPLIKVLERDTGKQVKFTPVTDYAALIEAQRVGKVDIGGYGPLSYVIAKNTGVQVSPVASSILNKGDKPGYQSYGIVPKNSTITDLAQFKGHTVCMVDPDSTSGYLYPTAGLTQAGVNTQKDIKIVFAGGHDSSGIAVAKGKQCQAGFAYDSMVDTLLPQRHLIKPGDLKVVWKSTTIPGSPMAILDSLSPDLKQKITTAFQEHANVDYLKANNLCTGAGCKAIDDSGDWGYTAVNDAFYQPVRDVCNITKAKACTTP
ncbi:phosphate/phosphite/phosphonate ABC transporter substrate-binding protein [Actinoplanes sp. TBRC 11911]|uniref:phosphate/phosphite/phosphonate ABC transporter substrate-binding protein n=1 Tax=Actinoplanes sp. TBRC 11911 TaxID=2729386 RepID=UPI00145F8232|nr:phosphate/phosphite/phosphonate ABC transporter substrate-binding protein [Actinoplanes sp. TBRC 11911]NMO49989.1 phosphate/phosphite/phosphonate ABC transporter substrate-binding protein [Actinoplanes sp. TBRC 11911]